MHLAHETVMSRLPGGRQVSSTLSLDGEGDKGLPRIISKVTLAVNSIPAHQKGPDGREALIGDSARTCHKKLHIHLESHWREHSIPKFVRSYKLQSRCVARTRRMWKQPGLSATEAMQRDLFAYLQAFFLNYYFYHFYYLTSYMCIAHLRKHTGPCHYQKCYGRFGQTLAGCQSILTEFTHRGF